MSISSHASRICNRVATVTPRAQRGFTMIELIIVMVIVGILLAIAIPAYTEQVRATRRATARADLMEIVQAKERFNTVNSTFVGSPCVDNNNFYTITCADLTVLTFTITAAPTAGTDQETDRCGSLIVNQAGQRTITGASAGMTVATCWP